MVMFSSVASFKMHSLSFARAFYTSVGPPRYSGDSSQGPVCLLLITQAHFSRVPETKWTEEQFPRLPAFPPLLLEGRIYLGERRRAGGKVSWGHFMGCLNSNQEVQTWKIFGYHWSLFFFFHKKYDLQWLLFVCIWYFILTSHRTLV